MFHCFWGPLPVLVRRHFSKVGTVLCCFMVCFVLNNNNNKLVLKKWRRKYHGREAIQHWPADYITMARKPKQSGKNRLVVVPACYRNEWRGYASTVHYQSINHQPLSPLLRLMVSNYVLLYLISNTAVMFCFKADLSRCNVSKFIL